MKSHELQALRRLLFYTIPEAAALVASTPYRPNGVEPRSWQYWESGRGLVPDDVAARLDALVTWRKTAISTAMAVIKKNKGGHAPRLVYYGRSLDWRGEPALWRPHQSACAALLADGCELVAFDSPSYAAWLGDRSDSEQMRAAWVAAA